MQRDPLFLAAFVLGFGMLTIPSQAFAHCDGLDGPVVKAAQRALETGTINFVLIWVQNNSEAEIRKAFEETLAVRKLGPRAQELADLYFFETLVRIHREGEGAPYSGLKPSGRDLGPAIPAADRAAETASSEPLLKLLTDEVRSGVTARFNQMQARKDFQSDDIRSGRDYVAAYVEFIHYVEGIHQASTGAARGHFDEATPAPAHQD